ncbi:MULTISPECIES: hypothetical protein [Ensifer]|jgi:hypothetical protein|uniref:Uncharacterized protein n=1 Tax=Ensifer canadensis TaxID=555315 RepID=A0AAW4FBM6_9HYPH|nr:MULTISPECIES: hypothetical protein [Ensifer]AHK44282.1 hypothetical protein OV14_2628 [Ensifer adhaerens OV14]MDP9629996.1 hypothetical protein [Ensifer adhaerens]KQU96854.1 hypothetical protein ASD00_18640 [Ensifer sp. Root31]KQW60841.1 hypothetical protein ASD02_24585 [Ensifer sp. Root1252]KQW75383.1 hypothetical protein ASD03_28430 [Ensifer sp. Root127]
MLWLLFIIIAILAGAFYMWMNARAERDWDDPDAGSAMVEFGRAFPDEAIRALHSTADRKAIFLRLHDGKAGFIQSHGTHYVCHVIQPGKVRVNSSDSGRGLIVHFPDFAYLDNAFEFHNAAEAAEVSLWLLGSFSPKSEFTADEANVPSSAQASE